MIYREASQDDTRPIAELHAESWRRHYRGAYRDAYLDGEVVSDRRAVWEARFAAPPENQFVVVAEDRKHLVGFACAYGREDAHWGTLLDNIHVCPDRQGQGAGTGLFLEVVRWCRASHADCGLYLWVLTGNERARRFYERLGAKDRGGEFSVPPGGGRIHGRRYAWATLGDIPPSAKAPRHA